MKALLLALLLLGSAACDAQPPTEGAQAQRLAAAGTPARPLPALTGRVVDQAAILAPEAESALAERLAALERETRDQLVVVTVASLEGEAIEALGLRLGNGWGIGRKDLDNGVLLIVAPADRGARIEVGKGLEGLLTDDRAQRILDEKVVPACREGHCDRAVADGAAAIAELLRSDRKRPQPKRRTA